jgi:hypothetical protein
MASPVTVGVAAIVAVPKNTKRNSVRFQNVSATQTLYFVRQIGTTPNIPSVTNYEVALFPASAVFDPNDADFESRSIAQWNVVSSAAAGSLAILETVKAQ